MAIVEFHGGRITHRYLMNKRKDDLARMYMDLLDGYERMEKRAIAAEAVRDEARRQSRPRCAACNGHGTVQKPWGDFAPCEACDGRGY